MTMTVQTVESKQPDLLRPDGVETDAPSKGHDERRRFLTSLGMEDTGVDALIGPREWGKHYSTVWQGGYFMVVAWGDMFHVTHLNKVHGWMDRDAFVRLERGA